MSFKPFMGILGTGLVTAHGAHWQQQRVKVGPVLRYDMLEHVAEIAHAATQRCAIVMALPPASLLLWQPLQMASMCGEGLSWVTSTEF